MGHQVSVEPFLHHHVSACSLQKGAMRLRSSVAWTGLVIVLLTKQRTTALSPSDKKKKKKSEPEVYVPRVLHVLNSVCCCFCHG